MIARGTGVIAIAFGSFLFAAPQAPAEAAPTARSSSAQSAAASRGTNKATAKPQRRSRAVATRGGLQCVPYARSLSGIQITGNAHTWWAQARGIYARGQRPEPGSVMSFPSIGRMRLGHVAVVSRIVNEREVLIDHANWAGPGMRKGLITRNVSVIDVSSANDWSSVRVALSGREYGSTVYPLNGFIYARAETPGTGTAFAAAPAGPAARPLAASTRTEGRSFSGIGQASATARALAGEPVRFDEIAEAQSQQPEAPRRRR